MFSLLALSARSSGEQFGSSIANELMMIVRKQVTLELSYSIHTGSFVGNSFLSFFFFLWTNDSFICLSFFVFSLHCGSFNASVPIDFI